MIVKIGREEGSWMMFDDVGYMQYYKVTSGSTDNLTVREDVIDFTDHPPKGVFWDLWLMDDKHNVKSQVLAQSPIYILNNEGKTIEKL